MFVDLFERGVFEGFIGAPLGFPVLDSIKGGPVLNDLDLRELVEDPSLGRVEGEFGPFRLELCAKVGDGLTG